MWAPFGRKKAQPGVSSWKKNSSCSWRKKDKIKDWLTLEYWINMPARLLRRPKKFHCGTFIPYVTKSNFKKKERKKSKRKDVNNNHSQLYLKSLRLKDKQSPKGNHPYFVLGADWCAWPKNDVSFYLLRVTTHVFREFPV